MRTTTTSDKARRPTARHAVKGGHRGFMKVAVCLMAAVLVALLVPMQFAPRQALADGYTLSAKLVDGAPSTLPTNSTFDVILTLNNSSELDDAVLTLTYAPGIDVAGIVTSEVDTDGKQVMKAADTADADARTMTFRLGTIAAGTTTIPLRFSNSSIADPITLTALTGGTCGYDVSTTAGSLGSLTFSLASTQKTTVVDATPVTQEPTSQETSTQTPAVQTPAVQTPTTETPTTEAETSATAGSSISSAQAPASAAGTGTSSVAGSETYTVTYEPGDHGTFQEQVTGSLAAGDPTPQAPQTTGDEGYTFVGWDPTPTQTVTGDVTYTAIWKSTDPSYVAVSFDSKGGSKVHGTSGKTGETISATWPKDPTYDGYTFAGWWTKDGSSTGDWGDEVSSYPSTYPDAAVTYYAKWSANDYKVRLNANHGSGTTSVVDFTYGTSTLLPANTFTYDGYTFSGWNTKADGSGSSYDDEADIAEIDLATLDDKTSTVVLYAQWKADSGSGNDTGTPTDTTANGGYGTESTGDTGYTTSDYTYSGGTTTKAAAATPYVIISKYTYGDSTEVEAGDTFILHLEVTNTSTTLNVENMIMSLDCGAALALTNTANSYYVASIPAGQTIVVEFQLKALASGKPEEATVGVDFKYEYVSDSTRTQTSSSEKIAIPVEQPDRFSVGQPTDTTGATTGTEATISIPYVNKGKSSVYNVEATLETDMDTTSTYKYLGNFDAGASGTIDFFVTPEEAGTQKATVKVTYEDSDNQEKSVDIPVTLDVQDASSGLGSEYGSEYLYGSELGSTDADGTSTDQPQIPWLPIGIGGGVALIAIITGICVHTHRKHAEERFLAGDDDDEDGKADAR